MKSVLMNTKASLKKRLQLFDKTVGSCMTWCAESWALRESEMQLLRVAQRAMLRRMVAVRRHGEEEWIQWMRRATRKALSLSESAGVRDWVRYHHERKWDWVGHVSRRPCSALTWRTMTWRDDAWCNMMEDMKLQRPLRPSRRRCTKFEDPARRFCASMGIRA